MDGESSPGKIICGGIAALLLTMGIARFAYTPLLPVMRSQISGFSSFDAGLLAAANYTGYLGGALLSALLYDIRIKDRIYRVSLVLAVLSTAAMAVTTALVPWLLLRVIAGFTGAAGMVMCSGLVMHALSRHQARVRMGFYFSGIGLGIALGAAAINLFVDAGFDWQTQWIALGVIGIPLAFIAYLWVPRAPNPPPASHTEKASSPAPDTPHPHFFHLMQLAYFSAGFGFVIYATFMVDMLANTRGLDVVAGWAWLLVGLIAAPSCIVWEWAATKLGELNALMLAFALQVVGILLLTVPGESAALTSAFLFGATFLGLGALVLTIVGRQYPHDPAKPMGQLTLSYGVAQVLGPVLAGWLAEGHGGYDAAMWVSASVLALGIGPLLILYKSGRTTLVSYKARSSECANTPIRSDEKRC